MRSTNLFLAAACLMALAACGGPSDKGAGATAAAPPAPAEPTTGVVALNTPPANVHLVSGWSAPEATGVWNSGAHTVLRLPHPDVPAGGVLKLTLDALTYLPKKMRSQRADVSIGGERVAELKLVSVGYQPVGLTIPGRLIQAGKPLELAFDLPDAVAPASVDPATTDKRPLGLGLRSVTVGS